MNCLPKEITGRLTGALLLAEFRLAVVAAVIFSHILSAQEVKVYTDDSDFDQGTLLGLHHNISGELQIADYHAPFEPFLWVANSQDDTVSKIDTRTGSEVARYRTGTEENITLWKKKYIPRHVINIKVLPGQKLFTPAYSPGRSKITPLGNPPIAFPKKVTLPPKFRGKKMVQKPFWKSLPVRERIEIKKKRKHLRPCPCSTAVDLEGNVWIANQGNGIVIKILHNAWFDENGNEKLDTSEDKNKNGKIDPEELLPWWEDEKVAFWKEVGEFDSEPAALAIDRENNVWVGLQNGNRYVKLHGDTGEEMGIVEVPGSPCCALVDPDGFLWSCEDTGLTKIHSHSGTIVGRIDCQGMGLATDRLERIWLSMTPESGVWKIDSGSGDILDTFSHPDDRQSGGVTVDDEGQVWLACAESNTVTCFHHQTGEVLARVPVGSHPAGVDIAPDGHVWVINRDSNNITRIDPAARKVVGTFPVGQGPCGMSGMTGFTLTNITTSSGVWKMIHDGKQPNIRWKQISWSSQEPEGTSISVFARSAPFKDKLADQSWEEISNGLLFPPLPPNQFLEIEIYLSRVSSAASPVLYDLTITPCPSKGSQK